MCRHQLPIKNQHFRLFSIVYISNIASHPKKKITLNSQFTTSPIITMSDKPTTNLTGTVPKAMDEQGTIGKQFTEQGAIGGTAAKIGGPLAKDGVIGKEFTTGGSIGGTVQDKMGGEKKA
ncbi:hypothetical protein EDB82DRAFT_497873 [Fusarium venenatum]|nr:hypothetical protein EDB82DRAFT_497873 [Fusarium venenatum]